MKILVVKPSSLGDVIHALPFLQAVKTSLPESRVDWVISNGLKELLMDNPMVDEIIVLNKDAWKKPGNLPRTLSEINRLRRDLRSRKYDVIVDLQGLLRSGLVTLLTPAASKLGFADAREGSRLFYNRKIPVNSSVHAVDKCLAAAASLGARTDNVRFSLPVSEEARNRVGHLLGDNADYLVIVPSARWKTKRWPAENFSSLVRQVPLRCVIAGSSEDRTLAQQIINGSTDKEGERKSRAMSLCGRTGLRELVALISGARAVVSNDSGPMHIAAALNVPVIGLFGPTDPVKTGPYGWQSKDSLTVMTARVSCSPCRRKTCDDLRCMKEIDVEDVLRALGSYI